MDSYAQSQLRDFASRLSGLIEECALAQFSSAVDDVAFRALALELFPLQVRCNAPYGQWVNQLGVDPAEVRDWRAIPCVPTAAFQTLELSSIPAGERVGMFRSSGTTSQNRSRHYHSVASMTLYEASLRGWMEYHFAPDGVGGNAEIVMLTPAAVEVPESSLVHMFDDFCRSAKLPCGAYGRVSEDEGWQLDGRRLLGVLEESVARACPVWLLGTAFSFVQLLDELAARGKRFRLPAGSRLLETGGYKGRTRELSKGELHGQLTASLGIPGDAMIGEYGMSELSSQAYDHRVGQPGLAPEERSFRLAPWARVEMVSPETGAPVDVGEVGLVQVFDLANVWSVMAIQTEDLGLKTENGFRLMGRAAESEPRGCSLMPV